MNNRQNFIFLLLFTLSTAFATAVWSQPNGFGNATPEKISELESMHQQATDFLIKNDFQGALRTYSDILLMEPDDETAYTGLGQIYMVQGRYKLANEAFKNALNINGSNEVALAGIRRIMDPDGMEGMISKPEVEAESALAEAKAIQKAAVGARASAPTVAAATAPRAGMEKRQSAVKVKKGYIPKKRIASRLGRLGLLHAQRTQMALRKAGFYNGPVNGMIGGSTKTALRDFQKNFGIPITGRITPATWSRLSEYLST